jgi:hypothetical protein
VSAYDYRPVAGGVLCDPALDGGQVTRIDLYTGPERTGTAAATAGPATRVRETVYRFAIPDDLPDGRYWCAVTFTPAEGEPPTVDRTVRVDLPLGTGLVASAEQVADSLGVPLPLSAAQRETYREEISKAQADVFGHLGRPLVPAARTLRDVTPLFGYSLEDPQAWPIQHFDDVVAVAGHVNNLDGTYDVRLLVGLDGAAEEPIVRYVVAHAAESIRNGPGAEGNGGRRVSSLSAEGQSISFEGTPVAGQPGALPTLDSLTGYRRHVYRPIGVRPATPWPYGSTRRYRRW